MDGYRAEQRKLLKLMGVDYLGFGLFGQIIGASLILAAQFESALGPAYAGEIAFVLSTGVLIGGCARYARFHGLNRAWGLLGLLNLPGVVMLLLLPLRGRPRARGAGFSVIFAEPYRRDVWRMDVCVKLDEKIAPGVREPIMLQLPRGARVGTAMKTLADVIPGLCEGELPGATYTINGQEADRRAELGDGDELIVKLKER